jgi:hypothetical protein
MKPGVCAFSVGFVGGAELLRLVLSPVALYCIVRHAATVMADRCAWPSLFARILATSCGVIAADTAHFDGSGQGWYLQQLPPVARPIPHHSPPHPPLCRPPPAATNMCVLPNPLLAEVCV